MAKPKRFSPTERRSWRESATSPKAVNAGRWQKRIFATGCGTLLAGLLIALLVILLWPQPQLRIAGLVIDDLDSFASLPIAYAGEDQAALEEVGKASRSSFVALRHQQASSFNVLPGELADLASSRDVAILYVAAHGASLDGKPVILCSDYNPREQAGRYAFTDLLKSLKSCKAKTCLLVLDTGRLEVDISGGMLLNQFPELVKAEVSKSDVSPNLWVIMANSFLEHSLVSQADRRSAFNYFFCKALRGEADLKDYGDDDKNVELNELAAFVQRQVSAWAKNSTGGMLSQTPSFLQGGKGEVQVTAVPEVYLARRQPPPKPATKDGTTAAAGGRTSASALTGIATSLLSPAAMFLQPNSPDSTPATATQTPAAASNEQPTKPEGDAATATAPPQSPQPAGDAKAAAVAAPPSAPAAPADSKPEASSTEPAKQPPAGTAAQSPPIPEAKAATAAPATDPATDPATAGEAGDSVPLATLRRRLDEQRKQAEEMNERSSAAIWTPPDFAPHLWRAFGDQLADCKARLDAGTNFDNSAATTSARIDDLNQFWKDIKEHRRDFDRREFLNQSAGGARASYDHYPQVRAAIQARNSLLSRLPRYIRYYTSPTVHASAVEFGNNLGDAFDELRSFRDLLEKPIADPTQLPAEANQEEWQRNFEHWLNAVEPVGGKLARLKGELDQFVTDQAKELIERSKSPNKKRRAKDTQPLQALVESHLLAGPTRADAIKALLAAQKPIAKVEPWTSEIAAKDAWPRAAHRAELELKLVEIAADTTAGAASTGATTVPQRVPTTPADVKSQCAIYTKLGAQLARAYAQLPAAIAANSKSTTYQRLRRAELQIHLVRGRDAAGVDKLLKPPHRNLLADLGVPVLPTKATLTVAPKLSATTPGQPPRLILGEPNKPQPLKFIVQGTPELPNPLKGSVHFDEKLLAVTDQNGRVLHANDPLDPPSAGIESVEVTLQITAITAIDAAAQLPVVSVRFEGERLSAESNVEVALPMSTHLELVIEGTPKTWTQPERINRSNLSHGALRPFPNLWVDGKPKGQTNYTISLRDSGGRGRELKYWLIALPRATGDRARSWQFPWKARHQLPADCETLVAGLDLKLPPGAGQSVPLPFAAAAPAPAAPAAPVPSSPPGSAPPPEPGIPIEGGLIAVFQDPKEGTEELIWLEADVLHPDNYLREPAVSYDRNEQRIEISVSAQDSQGLPDEGTEITLRLPSWHTGRKSIGDVLSSDRPDRAASLFAQVPPQRELVPVSLDVDGYPRAFIYDVPCFGGKKVVTRKVRNFHELKIVTPEDQALYGAISKLPVQLLVDFPPRDETEEAYTVQLLVNDSRQAEFHHDRRRRVWLLKPQAAGAITLQTAVDDLQAELKTAAFKNDPVAIDAKLFLNDNSDDPVEQDRRAVRIDAVVPEIQSVDGGPLEFRGVLGQPLVVRLRVTDSGSPITKVEVAFAQVEGALKDPKGAGSQGTDEYEAELPTEGKRPLRYDLYAQATDEAGNACPTVRMIAFLEPPPPPGPAGAPPGTKNDIRGVLAVSEKKAAGIKVTITGPETKSTTSGSDGSFEFKGLPAGAYKLNANGAVRNIERKTGPIDVIVSAPPAPATNLGTVQLE